MFGPNYLRIRDDYALNFLDAQIALKDYRHLKFRSVILENIVSASSPNNDTFLLDIPSKLFYKTMSTEFELYHIRAKMQYNDFNVDANITGSWRFTTFYYFLFFCNVAIHRLLNKGYVYFDESNSATLSNSLNIFLPDVVSIGTGNWSFKKRGETSSLVSIELKKAGANVHQLAWQDLKTTLKSFISFSSSRLDDPERVVLNNIYGNLRRNTTFSPSETRNYLNYVSEVAIDEVESKIKCPQINIDNFIRTLSDFNYNHSIHSSMLLSVFIGQYIYLLNDKIVTDLQSRDSKQFKLLKKAIGKG